jgi:signal transduction histidine kinase
MSVVVFDSSEQLRNREEVSLEALATGARVIMGAFWHEVRNLCTAMRLSVTSLEQRPGMADTEEVGAIHSLLKGLERMAALGLQPETRHHFDVASLRAVLDHMQIVVEPWFRESQISVHWHEADDLPLIRADHYGLLQVCLNLARNAHRALENCARKEFSVRATVEEGSVILRFHNTGAPVADPDGLFQPFQRAAKGAGLGLFVSRAITRGRLVCRGGPMLY